MWRLKTSLNTNYYYIHIFLGFVQPLDGWKTRRVIGQRFNEELLGLDVVRCDEKERNDWTFWTRLEVSTTAGLAVSSSGFNCMASAECTSVRWDSGTTIREKEKKKSKRTRGEAEREMTYCRIFDTNTLGYSFFFSSRLHFKNPIKTTPVAGKENGPWELAWPKRLVVCTVFIQTRKKERRRRYARTTYVCLMGSELVHLRAPLFPFFYSPPLLLIWRQSKAIRYWSDGGVVVVVVIEAPALKNKKNRKRMRERGCVSFARLYCKEKKLIINLFFFFFFSIQPTPPALNSRKQPTGWKEKTSR